MTPAEKEKERSSKILNRLPHQSKLGHFGRFSRFLSNRLEPPNQETVYLSQVSENFWFNLNVIKLWKILRLTYINFLYFFPSSTHVNTPQIFSKDESENLIKTVCENCISKGLFTGGGPQVGEVNRLGGVTHLLI